MTFTIFRPNSKQTKHHEYCNQSKVWLFVNIERICYSECIVIYISRLSCIYLYNNWRMLENGLQIKKFYVIKFYRDRKYYYDNQSSKDLSLPSRNCFDSSGGDIANDSIFASRISLISCSTSDFLALIWSSTSFTY